MRALRSNLAVALLILPLAAGLFLWAGSAHRPSEENGFRRNSVEIKALAQSTGLRIQEISGALPPAPVGPVSLPALPPLPRPIPGGTRALLRPQSLPAGAPEPVGRSFTSMAVTEEDVLRDLGGVYAYSGLSYTATLDRGWVLFERPIGFEDIGRPMLAYQLTGVTAGGLTIGRNTGVTPEAHPEDRTVSYSYGGVTERYRLDRDAVEQDFVVRELPPGGTSLRVTGAVSTNLTAPPNGTIGSTLAFLHEGKPVLTLSRAVAVDATGRRLDLELAYSNGQISIEVPAAWVSQAALPITIDPVIGTPMVEATGLQSTSNIDLAYNSTRNTWLVVWDSFVNSAVGTGIFGQILDAAGNKVGGVLSLGLPSSMNQTGPAVSYAPAVDRWLVAWQNLPVGSTQETQSVVEGTVLNGDGTLFHGPFTLDSRQFQYQRPCLAFDGTQWHVSYWASSVPGGTGTITVNGTFVSTAGVPTKTADILNPGAAHVWLESSAFANGRYVFLWGQGASPSGVLEARTMDTSGTLAAPVLISDTGGSVFSGEIAPGPANTLLLMWTNAGVITDGSLNIVTPLFGIPGGSWASAAYSTTSGEWFAASCSGMSVLGCPVLTSGPLAPETLGTTTVGSPQLTRVGWNQASNEMLVIYSMFPQAGSVQQLMAVRYQFGAIPPPSVPTGLTATGGDSQISLTWTASAGALGYVVMRSTASGGPFTDPVGYPSTNSFVDTSANNGTTYFYQVASFNLNGVSANSGTVQATPSGPSSIPALLVVGNTTLGSGDAAIQTKLRNQGYAVVVKGDSASATSDATGKALVVISSTVTPGNVNTKFTNVAVPVLNCAPGLMNPLGMTGSISGTNFGSLAGQTQVAMVAANASHPMAAGLTGTVTVLSLANTFTFGQPNANATAIASLTSDSTKKVIWVYEAGTAMPGLSAPARRVGFFLNATTAANLNTAGGELFDAAVRYGVGAPSAIDTVIAQGTNGKITISWDAGGGAVAYNVYRSLTPPAPGQLGTLIASNLSVNSYVDSGLTNGQKYYYTVVPINAGGFGAPAFSGAVQAVQASTVVGILGPAYIRRTPPTPLTTEYCTGEYQSVLLYTDANGVANLILPGNMRNYDTTVVPAWSWLQNPKGIGAITVPAQIYLMDIASTKNQGDGVVATQFHPSKTLYPGAPIGKANFTIKSRTKTTLNVWVKFPGNQPGRTARVGIDAKGVKYDPYEVDNTGALTNNAVTARGLIATQVQKWLRVYWAQALVDFYVEADQTTPSNQMVAGFDGSGNFNSGANEVASDDFIKLENDPKIHDSGGINVWLMKALLNKNMGEAIQGRTTCIVTDGVMDDGSASLVASHEIGHCLGLDDAENIKIDGPLNNTFVQEGLAGAQLRLLMLHKGCSQSPAGGWLTISEVERARQTALNKNYPAFGGTEPGP